MASNSQIMDTCKFMGPARQEFASFQIQASYFLDTYFPNWKDTESYMIPPIFNFKHPDVCDEVISNLKAENEKKTKPVISDRQGEEAEYLIYSTLQKLIHEGIGAPFIAVHGLDLNKHSSRLHKIFPDHDWSELFIRSRACFREYDFLLIGPGIGLVVIEVKSSNFEGHFEAGTRSLPSEYKKALMQLNSAEKLADFLQAITGVIRPRLVTKILFSANLDKCRYEHWKQNLNDADKSHIDETLSDVIQLFNGDQNSLYHILRSIAENRPNISQESFEAYAPVIAGISSITLLQNLNPHGINLNKTNFSIRDCIMKVNARIIAQNPILDHKRSKLHSASLLKSIPKDLGNRTKIMFLSPDQMRSLKGPNRQFILGAPGTGKTIVLQTKALELLANGQSVTVLAPPCYSDRYKGLFESHGYTNYKIQYWPSNSKHIYKLIGQQNADQYDLAGHIYNYINQTIVNAYDSFVNRFKWFLTDDHIIIDDVFDQELDTAPGGYFFTGPMITMAIAKILYPEKVVWAAMDSYTGPGFGRPGNYRIIHQLLKTERSSKESDYFSLTLLKHVMRCSENIFTEAYPMTLASRTHGKNEPWPNQARPIIAHKIKGSEIEKITKTGQTFLPALITLLHEIVAAANRLSDQGLVMDDEFAVIIGRVTLGHVHMIAVKNGFVCKMKDKIALLNRIPLHSWNNVSSLEWPIVVYCSCDQKDSYVPARFFYEKYRAMSRATSKVIEIVSLYERKN